MNNNFFLASFGYTTNLTYFVYDCGTNFKDLLNFIQGRSFICRKLINFKAPLFLFSEHFLNFFSFKFNKIFNLILTISNFLLFLKSQFLCHNFKIILTKNNFLNQILLNFNNNNKILNNFFNILIETDNYINLYNNKISLKEYSVYIGSHGNTDGDFSDLLLPSSTFVESSNFFFNLEGRIQMSQYSVISPKNVRELWRILYDFYLYIFRSFMLIKKKIKISNFFFNYDTNFIFVFSFCFKILNKNKFFLYSKKKNIEKLFTNLLTIYFNTFGFNIFINNFFLQYSIFNYEIYTYSNDIFLANLLSFYKGDIITRASKSMNLAYTEFEFTELNFF